MVQRKPVHYVNNSDFLKAMIEYKERLREAELAGKPPPRVPKYIGECLYKIANGLSYRPNFINYSYRDEMVGDALETAILRLHNFDPEKSKNPFAYFTQIAYFAFLQRIHKEKKQTYVRHKVMENTMLTDTAFEHGVDSDFDSSSMGSWSNDYVDDFVEKYESAMSAKKKAIDDKKGLDKFYMVDSDEASSDN